MCNHKNIVINSNGGSHFSGGEYWDDICENLLCLDCMQEFDVLPTPLALDGAMPPSAEPDSGLESVPAVESDTQPRK